MLMIDKMWKIDSARLDNSYMYLLISYNYTLMKENTCITDVTIEKIYYMIVILDDFCSVVKLKA